MICEVLFYFNRNALNDQYDLVRHQLMEKMLNEKTHSALVKMAYNCLKERDIVLGDRDFLNLQQYVVRLCINLPYNNIPNPIPITDFCWT